jgi:hypothetical protein
VVLGNTYSTIGNLTLSNVTISSGNVSINVSNVSTLNVVTLTVTGNETVGGNVTITGNVSVNVANVTTLNATSSTITGNETVGGNVSITGNVTANVITAKILTSPSATNLTLQSAGTTAVTVDTSQNVGIGVTPPTFNTGKALSIYDAGSSLWTNSNGALGLVTNAYYNSGWKYQATGAAARMDVGNANGTTTWGYAASGAAGTALTWTTAMTLDNSGNLLVGNTSAIFGASNRGVINVNGTSSALISLSSGASQSSAGYMYWDGTNLQVANNSTSGALTFNTNAATERMRIDSSGNVGIGTTSPTFGLGKGLQIVNSTRANLGLSFTGSDGYEIYYNGSGNLFIDNVGGTGGVIGFRNIATRSESMRIDSSGNLLVNTTTAAGSASTFKSTAGASQQALTFWNNASSGTRIMCTFGDSTSYSEHGNINWNGTIMTLSTTSDKRLKTNIVPATNGLQKVLDTKIYSYDMEGGHSEYGVLAQEMIDILPSAVCVGEDNEDGSIKRPWSVGYEPMVPMLIKAIQELSVQVTALQAQVTALQGAK